ncbi:lysozyme [Halomonas sp. McH1-25]|uniref:lysozyme n=1 Tax=unclassified Halomonas TaxID=2609666 RepID=UPI001EF6EE9B|nr:MULTISPECIES: lysozyme [unclassified Halomonas]MCG7598862.1 lysozyme [Halomonas sp. McH1-25]MCP1340825.1 lysozyme [Halomonas sp. FL8]MCP1361292.1 lysozyme [Halomonas sp. BBD45]
MTRTKQRIAGDARRLFQASTSVGVFSFLPPAFSPSAAFSPEVPMRTSDRGVELIKEFEGCRLRAYQDSAGVWTIGYGSTTDVEPGDCITPEAAERLLRRDLQEAEETVEALVKVPLNQCQFDALVSFAFNLGYGNLSSSTLLRKLNAHNYSGAQAEFKRWIYAGGQKLAGLERRREAEAQLFGSHPDKQTFHWYEEARKTSMP